MPDDEDKPSYLSELQKPEAMQRIANAAVLVYEQAIVTAVDQFIHVSPAKGFGGPTLIIAASWPDKHQGVDIVPGDQND